MEPMDIVGRTKEDASLPKGLILIITLFFFLYEKADLFLVVLKRFHFVIYMLLVNIVGIWNFFCQFLCFVVN